MKRLDINLTDRASDALGNIAQVTKRKKSEVIHDAIAFLFWAWQVNKNGYKVASVDKDDNVIDRLNMSMFENASGKEERDLNPAVR